MTSFTKEHTIFRVLVALTIQKVIHMTLMTMNIMMMKMMMKNINKREQLQKKNKHMLWTNQILNNN